MPDPSREQELLGVKLQGITSQPRQSIVYLSRPWPSWNSGPEGGPQLSNSPPWKSAVHPVTLAYIEEIQQDLFWETQVKQYGAEAAKPQDKILGRVEVGRQAPEGWPVFVRYDYVSSKFFENPKNIEDSPPSSPKQTPILDLPTRKPASTVASTPLITESAIVCKIMNVESSATSERSTSNHVSQSLSYAQKRDKRLRKMSRAIAARFRESK